MPCACVMREGGDRCACSAGGGGASNTYAQAHAVRPACLLPSNPATQQAWLSGCVAACMPDCLAGWMETLRLLASWQI